MGWKNAYQNITGGNNLITITNNQPTIIKLEYEDITLFVQPMSTININIKQRETILKLLHTDFIGSYSNSILDKTIAKVAKKSILIVDCSYRICNILDEASIVITNNTYIYDSQDFGYLYFDITTDNCDIELLSCNPVNRHEVLNAQKLVSLSVGFDFPFVSLLISLIRYFKIKKMCKDENIVSVLKKNFSNLCC